VGDVCSAIVNNGKIPEDILELELVSKCIQGQGRCFRMWLISRH